MSVFFLKNEVNESFGIDKLNWIWTELESFFALVVNKKLSLCLIFN